MKTEKEKNVYDSYTYNSKNPLARFAHRSRFRTGHKLIGKCKDLHILDFGCGDGRFLSKLNSGANSCFVGFEPFMESNLFDYVTIFKEWEEIEKHCEERGEFDVVICFEVLEHLNETNQIKELKKIHSVLKKNGCLIISVPIEIGFPSLLKNLRRISIHYDSDVYNFKNIVASMFGRKTKTMISHRQHEGSLHHMGFFYKELEKTISNFFIIESKVFSPFELLGANCNSQVFYRVKPLQ